METPDATYVDLTSGVGIPAFAWCATTCSTNIAGWIHGAPTGARDAPIAEDLLRLRADLSTSLTIGNRRHEPNRQEEDENIEGEQDAPPVTQTPPQ